MFWGLGCELCVAREAIDRGTSQHTSASRQRYKTRALKDILDYGSSVSQKIGSSIFQESEAHTTVRMDGKTGN